MRTAGFDSHRGQLVLGAITLAVLCLCAQVRAGRATRRDLGLRSGRHAVRGFGSLIWGGYTYRFHNIPLYVPPGHALVYVFGITAAVTPARSGSTSAASVMPRSLICTAWTVAGLHRVTALDAPNRRFRRDSSGPSSPGASSARAGRRCSRGSGSPPRRSRSRNVGRGLDVASGCPLDPSAVW